MFQGLRQHLPSAPSSSGSSHFYALASLAPPHSHPHTFKRKVYSAICVFAANKVRRSLFGGNFRFMVNAVNAAPAFFFLFRAAPRNHSGISPTLKKEVVPFLQEQPLASPSMSLESTSSRPSSPRFMRFALKIPPGKSLRHGLGVLPKSYCPYKNIPTITPTRCWHTFYRL